MKLREVIQKEGNTIVLYSSDKSKVLGRFEFGEGKKYKTEETARAAAGKREKQIQFFKHREAQRRPFAALVEKLTHTAAWHRCWDNVKKNYNDRSAAAICTWSVQRSPNPPDVYKGTRAKGSAVPARPNHPLTEATITLSLDDAYALDEVLAAEMELRNISAIEIDTDTWKINEVTAAGASQNPQEAVPAGSYTPEMVKVGEALLKVGLLEIGSRHTRREFQIIEEVIRLMTELHGELDSVDALLQATEAAGANIANYLEAKIHEAFTGEADAMLAEGIIERDERIGLSHAIGLALNAFSAEVSTVLPGLLARPIAPEYTRFSDSLLASVRESESRFLHEQVTCQEAQVTIDESGNLKGRVVVMGLSSNGNNYLESALQSVGAVFAGKPIYVDHPTRAEETDRPERSVRDLVGKLPDKPLDFYVDTVKEGPLAGRKATFFRNGVLSKTADWLGTLIKEKIAGDMSINAIGRGHGGPEHTFAVEAFTDSTSLDFVTRAGAGGKGVLESAGRPAADIYHALLATMTVAELAEVAPNILDEIAKRERQKAYGEKDDLTHTKEALTVAKGTLTLTQKALAEALGTLRAYRLKEEMGKAQGVVDVELAAAKLPEAAAVHVRRLLEADVRKLAEATAAATPLVSAGAGLKPGDPPNLEVPPDVAALPAEAQQTWLTSYVANLTKGEDQATHMAWAAVYGDGWAKDDAGNWKKETPTLVPGETMPAPMTAADLKKKAGEVIKEVRSVFAQTTHAGAVSGMGASAQVAIGEAGNGATQVKDLEEAFATMLSPEQAKIAAAL